MDPFKGTLNPLSQPPPPGAYFPFLVPLAHGDAREFAPPKRRVLGVLRAPGGEDPRFRV